MKIITKVKMTQKEKNGLANWLENLEPPCAKLNCKGIECDDCPINKIYEAVINAARITEETIKSIEVTEENE